MIDEIPLVFFLILTLLENDAVSFLRIMTLVSNTELFFIAIGADQFVMVVPTCNVVITATHESNPLSLKRL